MLHLKNLRLYTPKNPKFPELTQALYLIDEETKTDWYDSCLLFREDTVKLQYTPTGLIVLATKDGVSMWPINASVIEVEEKDLPSGFNHNDGWMYRDGMISRYVPQGEQAIYLHNKEKSSLLSEANAQIDMLKDKIEFEMDVEDNEKLLVLWKKYRIQVSDTKVGSKFPTKPR